MITREEMGRRIRRERERRELKQHEVARHLCIHPNSVGNWEAGLNFPKIEYFDSLCRLLRVTPNFLFGFTENRNG